MSLLSIVASKKKAPAVHAPAAPPSSNALVNLAKKNQGVVPLAAANVVPLPVSTGDRGLNDTPAVLPLDPTAPLSKAGDLAEGLANQIGMSTAPRALVEPQPAPTADASAKSTAQSFLVTAGATIVAALVVYSLVSKGRGA